MLDGPLIPKDLHLYKKYTERTMPQRAQRVETTHLQVEEHLQVNRGRTLLYFQRTQWPPSVYFRYLHARNVSDLVDGSVIIEAL